MRKGTDLFIREKTDDRLHARHAATRAWLADADRPRCVRLRNMCRDKNIVKPPKPALAELRGGLSHA